MPEGDTIHRAAATLHRTLSGTRVTRFESVLPALTRVAEDSPLAGSTIDRVESRGKHLMMHFSAGVVLRTHMRMNGSWHIYRQGERWQRPAREMRVLVGNSEFVAVGFNIHAAEFIRAGRVHKHRVLARLGPDVLDGDFRMEEAIRRLRGQSSAQIGDAMLNQRAIAGFGNVYKSELLFICRINPFARVSTLDDERLRGVIDQGRRLLQANVSTNRAAMTTYAGYRRTTRRDDPRESLWVYGRARLPCRRCGTAIRVRNQGIDARLTYWCPQCQPS